MRKAAFPAAFPAPTAMSIARVRVRRFRAIERVARRRLLYLHRARVLADLTAPPGNRLESLKGGRRGQFSLRINDQWRICLIWTDGDAYDVEVVDYH
jgi:proteic killer suppression protein